MLKLSHQHLFNFQWFSVMCSLHHSLQSRSVQNEQCFDVLSKCSVMRIQISLSVYNVFMSYKLSFKRDLLSSLLRAYIALLFVCDLIQLKIWLRVLHKKNNDDSFYLRILSILRLNYCTDNLTHFRLLCSSELAQNSLTLKICIFTN